MVCPRGHEGASFVRAGMYGKGASKRQLWWCQPSDKKVTRHRFAEQLPRAVLAEHDPECVECATVLERYEGPQHARTYEFPARTIAAALVSVGRGDSYFKAALTARATTGWARRMRPETRLRKGIGGAGGMVGDWVGKFAPVICAPVMAKEVWPQVVALDELHFVGRRERQRRGRPKQESTWTVFGAQAHPDGGGSYVFRLGAADRSNASTAAAFLRSVPGRPRFVVADGGGVWPKAVREAWPEYVDEHTGEVIPTPTLLRCHWHLSKNLREALTASGLLMAREEAVSWGVEGREIHWSDIPSTPSARSVRPGPGAAWGPTTAQTTRRRPSRRVRAMEPEPGVMVEVRYSQLPKTGPDRHPLVVAAKQALRSPQDWDQLVELAHRWQAQTLIAFLRKNQLRHEAGRGGVGSIGALEQTLVTVRRRIKDRAHLLTNSVRTQRMLDLMVLDLRGLADEREYAKRIAAHLKKQGGCAPHVRQGVVGAPRLHR